MMYKVEFDITFVNPTLQTSSLSVKLGNNTILTIFAEDIKAESHIAYGFSDTDEFEMVVDGDTEINVDNLVISEMYTVTFDVKDCDTDVSKYSSTSDNFLYSQSIEQLKMSFEWVDVVNGYDCEGCYYIDVNQITDQNEELERISNGTFTGSTDWTFGTNWILSGGAALFSGLLGDGNLSQTNLT